MTIFTVRGRYSTGKEVKHEVGAKDVHTAIASVLSADERITRIDSVILSELNYMLD